MLFTAVYGDGKESTYSSLFDRNYIGLQSTKLVRIFTLQQLFRDRISPKQYLIHLVVSTLLLQENPVLLTTRYWMYFYRLFFFFKNSSNLIVIVLFFCSRFNLLLLSIENKYHHKHLGKLDKYSDIFIFLFINLGANRLTQQSVTIN